MGGQISGWFYENYWAAKYEWVILPEISGVFVLVLWGGKLGNGQIDAGKKFGIRRIARSCRYIAFNAISCGTFDVVYAAVHPETLFPASIIVTGGLFKNSALPRVFSNESLSFQ